MAQYEILTAIAASDFPEEWYLLSSEEHFWIAWRFAAFKRQLRDVGVPTERRLHGLEIGCAHGVLQRQLRNATRWRVDGCDLNRRALDLNGTEGGRLYYYDIHDRRPEFEDAFDFLLFFDVIEHVEKTREFFRSALFHLKAGGFTFINVPALPSLYSRYDEAAGHYRRYDRRSLSADLEEGGLEIVDMRYWGTSLIPLLILRGAVLGSRRETEGVIRRGFEAPSRPISALLLALMRAETRWLPSPGLGTSLLALCRKP